MSRHTDPPRRSPALPTAVIALTLLAIPGFATAGPRGGGGAGGLAFDRMAEFDIGDAGDLSPTVVDAVDGLLDEALADVALGGDSDLYLVRDEDSLFAWVVFGDGPTLDGVDGCYEPGALITAAVERAIEDGEAVLAGVLGEEIGGDDDPVASSYAVGKVLGMLAGPPLPGDVDPVASSYAVGTFVDEVIGLAPEGEQDPEILVHGAIYELPLSVL